jgi:hypothetical protein
MTGGDLICGHMETLLKCPLNMGFWKVDLHVSAFPTWPFSGELARRDLFPFRILGPR